MAPTPSGESCSSPPSNGTSWSSASSAKDLPFLSELCKQIPKIELHQHVTGSLPPEGIIAKLERIDPELAKSIVLTTPDVDVEDKQALQEAWDLLSKQCEAVAKATASNADLEELFAACIERLANDGICYCELRIGLKAQPTKHEHLASLAKVIRQQAQRFPGTVVRLLISVARHGKPEAGLENVEIAIEHVSTDPEPVICGVELGGPATAGDWATFEPIFRRAREAGLRVALHCGEDVHKQEEWSRMMDFRPDRLGHCVYLDSTNFGRLLELKVPVEACPTCHQKVFGVPLEKNIFGRLLPHEQVVVCTDNPAFYETDLSTEYELCCRFHDLDVGQLFSVARRAIDFIFQDEATKDRLRASFDEKVAALCRRFGLELLESPKAC